MEQQSKLNKAKISKEKKSWPSCSEFTLSIKTSQAKSRHLQNSTQGICERCTGGVIMVFKDSCISHNYVINRWDDIFIDLITGNNENVFMKQFLTYTQARTHIIKIHWKSGLSNGHKNFHF